MGIHGHEVDPGVFDIEGDLAKTLRRVRVKERIVVVAELTDLIQGLERPNLVIGMNDGDQIRAVLEGVFEGVELHEAHWIDR